MSRWGLFGAFVAAPTLAATLYFGVLASDTYASESRFVVRDARRPEGDAGIGAIFKGFSTVGSENVLFVRDYLLSKQVVGELDRRLKVRESYGRGDFLARFPAPWDQNNAEAFYLYYKRKVELEVDPESSVAVLTVRGFDPQNVQAINKALLAKATDRIDELNSQIRSDTLAQAERELARAEARLKRAEDKLVSYRLARSVLDPERQAALELQTKQELTARLISAQARLAQIRALAPDTPQVAALASEVNTLARAVEQTESTVAGDSNSRAQTSEEFRAFTLERDIAVRMVTAAHEAVIRARTENERRHLYLEVISTPSLPDGALTPKRLRAIIATFLFGLLCWGVASLLRAGVREHRD